MKLRMNAEDRRFWWGVGVVLTVALTVQAAVQMLIWEAR